LLDGKNPREDQEELLAFAAYKGGVRGYAYSTVKVMIFAIRRLHIENREPDPLLTAILLPVLLKGLKRLQGRGRRKWPATWGLIEKALQDLDLDNWDDLVLALAIMLMYIFLLRSREALRKGEEPDPEQCARVGSVVLASEGKEATSGSELDDVDEVILHIPKSKADQEGKGAVLNAYANPGHRHCVVGLLVRAMRMRPGHFRDPQNFLLTLSNGRVLHRDVVAGRLRAAAEAMGIPHDDQSVISLCAGGASALWHAGYSEETVRRRGRWASDCWRIYTWEGREKDREVMADMMSSRFSLLETLARRRG